MNTVLFTPVIPNRGAAAHKGAAKRCQGCRQVLNYCLFIDILLHEVSLNFHFNELGMPPIFFTELKGAVNQKRLKNTGLLYCKWSVSFSVATTTTKAIAK